MFGSDCNIFEDSLLFYAAFAIY